jgi:hypothetical protein
MKVVVNRCFGGFGLSDAAYRKLIEWGIPCRKYAEEERDPKTGLYTPVPENEGLVIFDNELTPQGESQFNDLYWKYPSSSNRYWETWSRSSEHRAHPLIVRVVEELGKEASGRFAELEVVDVPDDVQWEVEEYDGREWVSEKHRTW